MKQLTHLICEDAVESKVMKANLHRSSHVALLHPKKRLQNKRPGELDSLRIACSEQP